MAVRSSGLAECQAHQDHSPHHHSKYVMSVTCPLWHCKLQQLKTLHLAQPSFIQYLIYYTDYTSTFDLKLFKYCWSRYLYYNFVIHDTYFITEVYDMMEVALGRPQMQPQVDYLNSLWPRQNGCHLADNILKCIFLNENVWIFIKISLKFFPKGPIGKMPVLVLIMAWRRPSDKPLSEAMMAYVADAYIRHSASMS